MAVSVLVAVLLFAVEFEFVSVVPLVLLWFVALLTVSDSDLEPPNIPAASPIKPPTIPPAPAPMPSTEPAAIAPAAAPEAACVIPLFISQSDRVLPFV